MRMATLCYLKKDGKTLMIYRNKNPNDVHQGKWNGLGGKFKEGETPEECVMREIKEESGFVIKNPKLKGILTFPKFTPKHDWYVYVFIATEFEGEKKSAGEKFDCQEGDLSWISDKKISALPLWEGDLIFLPWLDQNRFFSGKFIYEEGELKGHEVVFY